MLTCTRKCWRTKNQAKKFTRQFSRLLTPAPSLSVSHGNLPHLFKSYVVLSSLMFIMGNLKSSETEGDELEPDQKLSSSRWCRNLAGSVSELTCTRRYVKLLRKDRRRVLTRKKHTLVLTCTKRTWKQSSRTSGWPLRCFQGATGRFSNNLELFWSKVNWTVTRQWSEVTRIVIGRLSKQRPAWFFRGGRSNKRTRGRRIFEKSHWKSRDGKKNLPEVTRPSADCQTTFFGRFKRFGTFLKKVVWMVEQTVVGGDATVGRLSNNVFWTFQAIWRTILKKVAERSRDSGRRSRDNCRPTVKQRFSDVSSNLGEFWKKSAERSRDSGRRSRDRRPTVKQRFFDVSSN